MELDWCSDENLFLTEKFNENSIISKNNKKKESELINDDNVINNLNLNDCFALNLNSDDSKNVLIIINYLSFVSNYLRTSIRNKSTKFGAIKELTLEEYDLMIKYLDWLIIASTSIKKYFAVPTRKDNSFDPLNIKLFKTSSYKFCNFKESCSIHKNKQSKCDKNHFVFDMIINDIQKLKESIINIGFDNVNWTLNNKYILVTYEPQSKNYSFENINNIKIDCDLNEFIIDKILIFKSFDVISYVLNKMYDEAVYFLNDNIQSLIIKM